MAPGTTLDGRPCLVKEGLFDNIYYWVVDPYYIGPPTDWKLQRVEQPASCDYCNGCLRMPAEYVNAMAGGAGRMCLVCLLNREGEGVFRKLDEYDIQPA